MDGIETDPGRRGHLPRPRRVHPHGRRGSPFVLVPGGVHAASPGKTPLSITSATSPWQGYTSSWEEEEAGKHIEARALDPAWATLPSLSAYAGAAQGPLLAIDRGAKRVHVDGRFFGNIERIDVPKLRRASRRPSAS